MLVDFWWWYLEKPKPDWVRPRQYTRAPRQNTQIGALTQSYHPRYPPDWHKRPSRRQQCTFLFHHPHATSDPDRHTAADLSWFGCRFSSYLTVNCLSRKPSKDSTDGPDPGIGSRTHVIYPGFSGSSIGFSRSQPSHQDHIGIEVLRRCLILFWLSITRRISSFTTCNT